MNICNSCDMGIKLRWDNTVTVMHQCIAIHNVSMRAVILQTEYQCIAVLINLNIQCSIKSIKIL